MRVAGPLLLIQGSVAVMQLVDAWMVSYLGERALAASLPGSIVFWTITTFGTGMLLSVNTFVAQSLGRGELRRCGHFANQGMLAGTFYGLLLLPLALAAPSVFRLFGHESAVRALEVGYFTYMLPGAPFLMAATALGNFFIGIHRPQVLAWVTASGMGLNAIFNYLFIFGPWGLPALGLRGAGLGTALASAAQFFLLAGVYFRAHNRETYGTARPRVAMPTLVRMLKVGIPSGTQIFVEAAMWSIVLVYYVGLYGTAHLAATTVVVRLMHLSFMPGFALGLAVAAQVGRSIGAGERSLAEAQAKLGAKLNVGYMGSCGLAALALREPLMAMFTSDPEVLAVGVQVMIAAALMQIFDAININYVYALRGAGDTLWTAVITAIYCVVFFLGGSELMWRVYPEFGSLGPWAMTVLYLAALSGTFYLRWRYGPWRKIDLFRGEGASEKRP